MPLLHQSITELLEQDLVAYMLASLYYRNTLLNIKGLLADDALIRPEVELREFHKNLAGDIDILVVPNGLPDQATAIQVKRFEVTLSEDDDYRYEVELARMAKLFAKGVQQANFNASLGFSQVYLWVFVLIDARLRNSGRLTYEGPDSFLNSRIDQTISPANLSPGVGLMGFDWVQPSDRPPFTAGASGIHLDHLAGTVTQPQDLTEWLRSLRPSGRHQIAPSWTRKPSSLIHV